MIGSGVILLQFLVIFIHCSSVNIHFQAVAIFSMFYIYIYIYILWSIASRQLPFICALNTECKTGITDISCNVKKFYSQFNNVSFVSGKNSNEMPALHLTKSYCLPTLLYGCETCCLTSHNIYKLSVVWNSCYLKIFCGKKVLSYCNISVISYQCLL